MSRVSAVVASLFLAGCSVFGVRSGYEQPPYAVIATVDEAVQIRRYQPRLAAEATVAGESAEAGRQAAFRLLFDYISGANTGGTSIAMTTPVATETGAQKIAMGVPVETATGDGGRTTMRFFLPAQYGSIETAPQPTDPRVRLVPVPEETVAALRFSGFWDEETVAARRDALVRSLEASQWQMAGAPVSLFYDPPWTIPWLRRNEVAVVVTPRP